PFTLLRRSACRRASQVGAPRRATRSTARAMVLRFTCNCKPSRSTAATSAWGIAKSLFILTASASASGPNCTFAAPRASEVCRESRLCTRLWHFSQWPMSISKRRQNGLAHDFLLILRLGPIEDHAPPAATPPRQGHGNDFVHLLGR